MSTSFTNPATQTPLFVAQEVTCAYPISDLYASSPRYLYYALLVASFIFRGHSWLANVFLGAAATYAGTAAIEAFILSSYGSTLPPAQTISIPYISNASVAGNQTLESLTNLVTDLNQVR